MRSPRPQSPHYGSNVCRRRISHQISHPDQEVRDDAVSGVIDDAHFLAVALLFDGAQSGQRKLLTVNLDGLPEGRAGHEPHLGLSLELLPHLAQVVSSGAVITSPFGLS